MRPLSRQLRRRAAAAARIAAGAILAAGVVGLLRQRHEIVRVRRGERAALGPATRTAPSPSQGLVASALAAWTPRRPTTRAGRAAAAIWAGPLTLVGLALGAVSGGRARWDGEHSVVMFEGARRGSVHLLRLFGAQANTVGQVVIARPASVPPALLAHEAVHARQAERLGIGLVPLYALLAARFGYRRNPLERAARSAARAHATGSS